MIIVKFKDKEYRIPRDTITDIEIVEDSVFITHSRGEGWATTGIRCSDPRTAATLHLNLNWVMLCQDWPTCRILINPFFKHFQGDIHTAVAYIT